MALIARDTFERSVASGFGNADIGGAYSGYDVENRFSVVGGAGQITSPASTQSLTVLGGISATETDTRLEFTLNALSSNCYIWLMGRRIGDNWYAARLNIQSSGAPQLHMLYNTGTQVGANGAAVPFVMTANTSYTLRFQVYGVSPTTMRMKVWPTGTNEPLAWATTGTSTEAGMQAPGAVGFGARVPSGAPTLVTRFDNLLVTTIDATALASGVTDEVLGVASGVQTRVSGVVPEILGQASGVEVRNAGTWIQTIGVPTAVQSVASGLLLEVLGAPVLPGPVGIQNVARTGVLKVLSDEGWQIVEDVPLEVGG